MQMSLRAGPGPEWARAISALSAHPSELSARADAVVGQSAEKLAASARQRALALPSSGRGSTGLRRRVASGVQTRRVAGPGSFRRIITTMPDSREAMLPRGLDSGTRGWRHPVFGRDDWVQQQGGSWFRETVASGYGGVATSLQAAVRESVLLIASYIGPPRGI